MCSSARPSFNSTLFGITTFPSMEQPDEVRLRFLPDLQHHRRNMVRIGLRSLDIIRYVKRLEHSPPSQDLVLALLASALEPRKAEVAGRRHEVKDPQTNEPSPTSSREGDLSP